MNEEIALDILVVEVVADEGRDVELARSGLIKPNISTDTILKDSLLARHGLLNVGEHSEEPFSKFASRSSENLPPPPNANISSVESTNCGAAPVQGNTLK